uniref:Cytochrome b6-f complex subunit 6 n=1 Tax=Xylochloris irregularis TaxID=480381 RepID=A0A097KM85_9CHLO|nr:subunit VI of cytochrome b6/f complex [Xylochloris irregularis]AIT94306.1 subunit VI of cytochrome b6/f complex [Xylochloris irregularis]
MITIISFIGLLGTAIVFTLAIYFTLLKIQLI